MAFAGPAFISYNHADLEFAGWLASELILHRIAVWFDQWEMRVGDSLRQKVERGIETSGYLIIVLSPDSVQSDWVSRELNAAFVKELEGKRVFILPALHRDCNVPLFLRDKRYADFRENREKGLQDILHSIDRSEVPGHGRDEEELVYTDWTTDWRFDDNRHITEIIINQHSKVDGWSVICTIRAEPNDKLEKRLQEFIDSDLEWFAISFALNSIVDIATSEQSKTDVIYIDGAKEATTEFGWRDSARNMEMRLTAKARRLGTFTNMDTIFEYGSLVRRVVDEHNERNRLIIPKSERAKAGGFLVSNPIDTPYKFKDVAGTNIWIPK